MRRRKALGDLDRDVRDHLEREIQEHIERGLSPETARRAALRAFGSTAHSNERTRAIWIPIWLDQLMQDARYGLRMLLRNPAFTAVAVVTLAIGIGANTAVFSLIQAIVVKPLPVRDPEQLVIFTDDEAGSGTNISSTPPEGIWHLYSYEIFSYLQQQPLPFEAIAATRSGRSSVLARFDAATARRASPELAEAHLVSGNYFEVMATLPAMGRALTTGDDRAGAPPVAVVSDRFWRERLEANPSVVGTTAFLNDTAFTIVGIAAPEFFGERVRQPPDFWVPLQFQAAIEQRQSWLTERAVYWLTLVGRLSPGATLEGARAAATGALRQFLTDRARALSAPPDLLASVRSVGVALTSARAGLSSLRRDYAGPLQVVLLVVGLVLLLACANVGNLMLARAGARRQELAVRAALGAGHLRLVRQLLTESMLIAVLGGMVGVLLAYWSMGLLLSMIGAANAPVDASLDASVLVFTTVVTAASALVFGLAPAAWVWREDLIAALKVRGTHWSARRRWRVLSDPLVAVQMAICVVLLVAAALLARSLVTLGRERFGFDADRVLLVGIYPRMAGYTPATAGSLYTRLLQRLRAEPGVESVTVARYSPFGGDRSRRSGRVDGYTPAPDEDLSLEMVLVGPSYAETLGVNVRLGRSLTSEDMSGSPVGMVNETFVRRYLPGQNPIGRRFSVRGSQPDDPDPDIEIVGVLADATFRNPRGPVEPIVFVREHEEYGQLMLDAEIALRVQPDRRPSADRIRRAIRDVEPGLPIDNPRLLSDQIAETFGTERLSARLVGGFSGIALLLACVGLYGVAVQRANRRTTEIGIRLALGARPVQVIAMLVRDAVRPMIVGLLIGLPAAAAVSRLLRAQLFGIGPNDPLSFAGAVTTLALVAVAAGTIPARRASRIDPTAALRSE